jgi:FdhD protein
MAKNETEHHIKKVNTSGANEAVDILATEEPLEIKIKYYSDNIWNEKAISVTMRTPGDDPSLAVGFLYTEGIILNFDHIKSVRHLPYSDDNIIKVELDEQVNLDLEKLNRHFYTTSSCGVCGKSSIAAIKTVCNISTRNDAFTVDTKTIYTLPDTLRAKQEVFEHTGGLHASALFNTSGNMLMLREDVGRHNALDKLIGAALEKGLLPLDNHILLLSGRASFELIQKAAMAGIKMVAAVGAPSSLAVQTAAEMDITLIGFLRGERFNIYTHAERVNI